MRTLPRPARNHTADLDLVISTTTPGPTKVQLQALRNRVLAAYSKYEPAAAGTAACPPEGLVPAEREAMEGSYEALRRRKALKPIREHLLRAVGSDGYCPMCGIDQATTLDHYAPKATYSEFAVLALNLVPACAVCNQLKQNPVTAGVEVVGFVHHYLHPLPVEPMLHATIHTDGTSISVSYGLHAPVSDQGPFDFNDLLHQADVTNLLDRIERAANTELISAAISCRVASAAGGATQVRSLCTDLERVFKSRWGPNNWKAALYRALATSDEFCGGGYQLLAAPLAAAAAGP